MQLGASPEMVDWWARRLLIARDELAKKRAIDSDEPFVKAHMTIGIRLMALKDFIIKNKPKEKFIPVDEGFRVLFNMGQMVLWPFVLAFALALRISKVTIDVFGWAGS